MEDAAKSGRCLAIDVNSGHLDARILDVHGNPIGMPIRKNTPEQGSSAHRLGALREAVSQLVKRAQRQGVTVIAIEKLNFAGNAVTAIRRPQWRSAEEARDTAQSVKTARALTDRRIGKGSNRPADR